MESKPQQTCWILDRFCDKITERTISDQNERDSRSVRGVLAERFATKTDALKEMLTRAVIELHKALVAVALAEERVKKCRKRLSADFRL